MGLQSALTTSLTGLQAAETVIDVVGNNVANSSTVGFKESNVLFATQFLQTQSIGSAPSDSTGGTNPRQIGLGVKVAAINPNFGQGTIQISSNPLDVAIQGDGFLIVQGSQGEEFYTRNGQLQTNSNNELVTVTGNRVQGYNVDEEFNIVETLVPIRIPLGEAPVTQSTENAIFQGVLTPLADVGDTPGKIASEALGRDTVPAPDLDAVDISDLSLASGPSGTASSALAAGLVTDGTYDYRMTFYLTSGLETFESSASDIIETVTIAAGPNQIDLSNLPVDASGTWTGRNLYRRKDGAGDYELVTTIADQVTTIYSDNNDGPLGAALVETSLDPNAYSYYITWEDAGGIESRPTGQIGSFSVTGADGRIRIDNLPQPGAGNFINIYRNIAGNASEFHLVDTVANGTTSYVDSTPDATIIGNAEVDLIGAKAQVGTLLQDVFVRDGDTYSNPFGDVPGTLSFTGRRGDRTLSAKELAIDATTTVADLIDFMEEAFGVIDPGDTDPFDVTPGGSITDGVIQFISNMGIQNELSVGLSSLRYTPDSSSDTSTGLISFTETQAANGEGSTTDFAVFDSLGTTLNVRLTTVLEAKTGSSTTYRWFATSEDNEPSSGISTALATGTLSFDGNGVIDEGDRTATIGIDRNLSASVSPLEFTLDFSQVSGLALQNNLGESTSSLNMIRQDGFPPGILTSFIVTESGLIRGIFSNGAERPLGQIRMVRFSNNTGLQQVGENLFAVGVNSGDPIEDNPGANGIGSLTAGALELSNTDIGQNLIKLILASTQYRGGARVITTTQQLLDELLNLRR